MNSLARFACVLGLTAMAASDIALARIKLISLPVRDRVEMRLDHSSATLVEEERTVPLTAGVNTVDFSWTNTRVDPNSIVLRIVSDVDAKVLSVSYPPNEQALVWRVSAPAASSAKVRISYLLGRIQKQYHYRALATNDERSLRLSQYVRLKNESNENFGPTQIRLDDNLSLERELAHAQTREVLVKRWPAVPVEKTFTASLKDFGWFNQAEQKLQVAMHYVVANDAASGLGEFTLPDGKARIFQADGRGGNAFLGEDWGKRTVPGDKMRLFLGLSRDIAIKRTVHKNTRQKIEGNLFNQHVVLRYEFENFKDTPVTVRLHEHLAEVRRQFLGGKGARMPEWEIGEETTFEARPDPDETTIQKVAMSASLPAASNGKAEPVVMLLHLVLKNEW